MSITINKIPNENGTAKFTCEFLDEDDNVITMVTSAWQLMYPDGSIVTGEGDVVRSFANGSFSGTIVPIYGADLAITGDEDTAQRIFAFQGTYNSNTLGNGVPLNEEYPFPIKRLVSQDDI